jgi:uncharacterized membrane protein
MFLYLIADGSFGQRLLPWIDGAATVIGILAVAMVIVSIFFSVGHNLLQSVLHSVVEDLHRQLKIRLGRTLLLGLEILVAADIVRTVALEATLERIAVWPCWSWSAHS